jgi:hypothetical protein
VLLAAYLKLYKDEYQPHPLTYELFKGDYVQIVVQGGIAQNGGKDQHPMHLVSHHALSICLLTAPVMHETLLFTRV